jgi:hypothetical protein
MRGLGLVADLEAVAQRLARDLENIAVGLAETVQRTGTRADEADLQRLVGAGRDRPFRLPFRLFLFFELIVMVTSLPWFPKLRRRRLKSGSVPAGWTP